VGTQPAGALHNSFCVQASSLDNEEYKKKPKDMAWAIAAAAQ